MALVYVLQSCILPRMGYRSYSPSLQPHSYTHLTPQERSCIAANFTQEVRFEFVDSVCNLEVYKVPYQLFSHPRPVETTYKENVSALSE